MRTPASASRATALPPVGCIMPTVSPSVSRRSFLGGISVVIVTGAALLPKKANRPARGCTSEASSSIPGIRLIQPLPAARSARNSAATARRRAA